MEKMYLSENETRTLLQLGKTVELFLGKIQDDETIVSWIDLRKTTQETFVMHYYQVYDEGNRIYSDIYSFTNADPEESYEEFEFSGFNETLEYISNRFKLDNYKFVNQGLIQEEYAETHK